MSLFSAVSTYLSFTNSASNPGKPALSQRMGPLGLQLLEYFEGLRLTAYQDSAGIQTIGYGHTANVKAGDVCTFEQAVEFLAEDLKETENCVLKNVTAKLKQNEFDAIVSFVYNIGCGNFLKSSAYKNLQRFKFDSIPYDLSLWNKSGGRIVEGLVTRRHAEGVLFATGTLDFTPVAVPDNEQA